MFLLPYARPLTRGERLLAEPVFRHALDYAAVSVCRRRFMPFQNRRTAMSPNGALYFPPAANGEDGLYRADFSTADWPLKSLFLHEMVHVWQHRLGYGVLRSGILIALRGGYRRQAAYRYGHLLGSGAAFADLNMEQQARLVEDYFTLKWRDGTDDPARRRLLGGFLDNPADPALLPRSTRF